MVNLVSGNIQHYPLLALHFLSLPPNIGLTSSWLPWIHTPGRLVNDSWHPAPSSKVMKIRVTFCNGFLREFSGRWSFPKCKSKRNNFDFFKFLQTKRQVFCSSHYCFSSTISRYMVSKKLRRFFKQHWMVLMHIFLHQMKYMNITGENISREEHFITGRVI